jgi:hypothetical protein
MIQAVIQASACGHLQKSGFASISYADCLLTVLHPDFCIAEKFSSANLKVTLH